jgi:hypothetical protein
MGRSAVHNVERPSLIRKVAAAKIDKNKSIKQAPSAITMSPPRLQMKATKGREERLAKGFASTKARQPAGYCFKKAGDTDILKSSIISLTTSAKKL